jgi:hypothetical protein
MQLAICDEDVGALSLGHVLEPESAAFSIANCLSQIANAPGMGPSEDYGNEEHTTVAAFLPWRGS